MTPISRHDWEECGKGLAFRAVRQIRRVVHGQQPAAIFLSRRSPSSSLILVRGATTAPTYRQGLLPRIFPYVPDHFFADPRLAASYDDIDGDGDDLDHYEAIVEELGTRTVLDFRCCTGVLAFRFSRRGITRIGLDPADASLAIARTRPGADRITWLPGDVRMLPSAW